MSQRLKIRWAVVCGTTAFALICAALLAFVTWSLLTPDPYAIVRESSLRWMEQISDLLIHASVFAVLSAAWLSLTLLLNRELPMTILILMLTYCVSMEGLQAFVPGRNCDPLDGIANVCGFLTSLMLIRLFTTVRSRLTAVAA